MFECEDHVFTSVLSFYNRTIETFEDDVVTIRKWIKTQKHLPEVMDNKRILNFLLLNKCCVERTKEKIDNYYTIRNLLPEFYPEVNSQEVIKAMEIAYYVVLPKLTEDLCRVHILKIRKSEAIDDLEPLNHVAGALQIQEVRLKEDRMFNDIAVLDMQDITWSYLKKMTPTFLLKCATIYEKIYSNRLKAIYIINSFLSIDRVLTILKRIFKPKIFKRINFCQNSEILFEVFSKEMIPEDYGGTEKSLEELRRQQCLKLLEHKKWINSLNQMKVDENLRPEKLKNDEILGFYGNFKQLLVD